MCVVPKDPPWDVVQADFQQKVDLCIQPGFLVGVDGDSVAGNIIHRLTVVAGDG